MKDLIARIKTIDDWESRTTQRGNGHKEVPSFNDVAGHAELCINCKVPDGCDDTHALCELRRIHKIHADGSRLKKSEIESMKSEERRQQWAEHYDFHPMAQSFDEKGQGVLL